MAETADMFFGTIQDLADGPRLGGHAATTEALMRRFSEKRFPLKALTDPKMMNRSLTTLKAHASKYKLAFPDYVPVKMRKAVALMQRGDFFEIYGDAAEFVAGILGIVVTKRDGHPICAVPVHGIDDAKTALRNAFVVVKVVRQRKRKKAAKNG